MKKLFSAVIIVMMVALAGTLAVSAAEVYAPDAEGLYTIEYTLEGTVEDGTQFGMVVIEATGDEAFALDEATIRYIDQVGAADNAITFDTFAPMDLKNEGTYKVYIGGGALEEATLIGTLSTEVSEETGKIKITGTVKDDVAGTNKVAVVKIFKGADEITATVDGATFSAEVDANATYSVTFTKDGYLKKTITDVAVADAAVDMGTVDVSALAGNVNGDDKIKSDDLGALLSDYSKEVVSEFTYSGSDVNGDGKVKSDDLGFLLGRFNNVDVTESFSN